MGRYGLAWPSSKYHDLAEVPESEATPPRKVIIFVPAFSTGSLATPWLDQWWLSDVPETGDSYGILYYDCQNLSAGDDFIRVRCEIQNSEFPPIGFTQIWWLVWLEYFHEGVLMGHTPHNRPFGVPGGPFPSGVSFALFTDLNDPALWGANGFLKIATASWADQPEWHPYRLH